MQVRRIEIQSAGFSDLGKLVSPVYLNAYRRYAVWSPDGYCQKEQFPFFCKVCTFKSTSNQAQSKIHCNQNIFHCDITRESARADVSQSNSSVDELLIKRVQEKHALANRAFRRTFGGFVQRVAVTRPLLLRIQARCCPQGILIMHFCRVKSLRLE